MSITLSLNTIAWLSLALFWVILMFWPYPEANNGGFFPDFSGAVIAVMRFIVGLLVTVVFMGVKIATA